jgi:hypothetical protein
MVLKMEEETLYPLPNAGRHLFMGYALGLLILLSLGFFGLPLLVQWIVQQIPLVQILLAESLGITFLIGFIPPSLFIIRTGKRIISENAYPHSGMKVLYPTKIQRGLKAMRRGKTLLWLGRFAICALLLGSGAIHFICYKFLTDPMFFVRH